MKNSKEYDNLWYAKNKERIRAKKVKQGFNNRDRNAQFVVNYLKEHPCIDCGEADFIVLEFDHKESDTKLMTICDMVRGAFSIARIKAEIDKCVIRCANCHRRKTAKDLGWYKRII